MIPLQRQMVRNLDIQTKRRLSGTLEFLRLPSKDIYNLQMFFPNDAMKKNILQSLSEISKSELKKNDALSLERKRLVYKALESNQRFLWGEAIIFERFSYSKHSQHTISGMSTLLKAEFNNELFQQYKNRSVKVILNFDKQKGKSFYPADFMLMFSKESTVEERNNAQFAIRGGFAGMNCCQFVYYCLEKFYPKYQDIFSVVAEKTQIDKNAFYEPLAYQESQPFGYKPAPDLMTSEILNLPPEKRKGFVAPKDVYDPFDPNNPRPGDVIFFIEHVNHVNEQGIKKPSRVIVKHVCIYIGLDQNGDMLVTGNFKYPAKNGYTVSTSKLSDLVTEMKRQIPSAKHFKITSVSLPRVMDSLNEYAAHNRDVLKRQEKKYHCSDEEYVKLRRYFHIF